MMNRSCRTAIVFQLTLACCLGCTQSKPGKGTASEPAGSSQKALVGSWQWGEKGEEVTLTFNENGSYVQQFHGDAKGTEKETGKWRVQQGKLLLTIETAPSDNLVGTTEEYNLVHADREQLKIKEAPDASGAVITFRRVEATHRAN